MAARIYTRSGDRGETGLVDGSRVSKDAARVEAYGALDEANAWVGAALALVEDPALVDPLTFLQHRLFNCCSNLATPPGSKFEPPTVSDADVAFLEASIDRFEAATGTLTHFVLPGGGCAAGMLHVARTVCRRAERRIVTLGALEPVDAGVLKLVNRASDFLFAAARLANRLENRPDVAWDQDLLVPGADPGA